MQMLVDNSNKYAMQKRKHSYSTSAEEIRLFLAVMLTSGYAPLPRRRLYWDPTDDVCNEAISCSMTRNRFEELLASIHIADNNSLPPGNKMAKVHPLFTVLNMEVCHILSTTTEPCHRRIDGALLWQALGKAVYPWKVDSLWL